MAASPGPARNPLDHADSRMFELLYFVWAIRKQTDGTNAERLECIGGKLIVAQIRREAQPPIRFHGIQALVLELVGFELIEQANAPAFLGKIKHDSGRVFGDPAQG